MYDYDIWTFTDASIGMNMHKHSSVGVYGFVHMSKDFKSGNLVPLAGGFQAINKFEIQILEHCAVYLALLDIRRIPNHQSICIVTDSNITYTRLNEAVANRYGSPRTDWMKTCDQGNAMVWNCADLYVNLTHQGYRISLELCKSHVDHIVQRCFLERDGKLVSYEYANNISIGNNYADYYVRNIAVTGNLSTLQQYSTETTYFESTRFGYTTQMLR